MQTKDDFYFYTEDLTVGYDGVPLIRDIEIQMRRGEILTLIGPNGAGKTTVLRSLIRQLALIAGVVCLGGSDMEKITSQALSEKMSVVLTDRIRPELMTCWDVVATGRHPYTGKFGVLTEKDKRAVRDAMERVHVKELAGRDFAKMSDGQKQRVMLARALAQEPDIIILDEPTSFLDIKYKLEFLSAVQHMAREENLSVILSMHELDLAERISDRIACIRGDRVDRFGTPEEIFSGGYIAELYGMTVGSYDERTGNVELVPVGGEPRVFVIAGNGTGTPVFRRLQREGIPFATGILYENDLDYPSAKALAEVAISVKPFSQIDEKTFKRAREVMRVCGSVLCPLDTAGIGEWGHALSMLCEEAAMAGKLADKI